MSDPLPLATEQTTSSARSDLLHKGYCVVDGRLPHGTIEFLSQWSDDWLDGFERPDRWKYQGSDIHVIGLRNPAKRYPDYPKDKVVDFLIEHPSEIMDELGLGDFKAGGAFQIISKPKNGPPLYWHQDWARWDDPLSLSPWPQQVFLNWYLSDTNPENGCLRVIPGSHLKRFDLHENLVPPHEGGGYEVKETNEWMFFDHPNAVDVPVRTGELVIADARLLHGTHANNTSVRRTVLLGWYFRRSNEVPKGLKGPVPDEIRNRDPETPFVFNRQPGEFLK